MSAVHIPRTENNTVDHISRLINENTEYRLYSTILKTPVAYFTSNHIINLFIYRFKLSAFQMCLMKSISKFTGY